MIAHAARLLSVTGEALAVYVVAEWLASGFDDADRNALNALTLVIVALVAYAVPNVVEALKLAPRPAAWFGGIVAFVVLYGALRVEFAGDFALWDFGWVRDFITEAEKTLRDGSQALLGAALLAITWARTSFRAANEIDLESLPRSTSTPFIIVTIVLVLSIWTDRTGEIGRAGAAYYAAALLTLAGSQLAMSGATFGELRAGGTTALLLAGTVGVTVVGVIVFWLAFGVIGPAIGPGLGKAAEVVATAVLTPPAWLLEQLFKFLIARGFELPKLDLSNIVQDTSQQANKGPDEGSNGAQQAGIYLVRALALIVAVGVLVLAVAWYMRFRRRLRAVHEQAVSAGRAGSFRDDLGAALRSLFERRAGGAEQALTPVRRLYREVLTEAEKKGQPRMVAETPDEFEPRLAGAFDVALTADITRAFDQARYGGREPAVAEVQELERRWRARS